MLLAKMDFITNWFLEVNDEFMNIQESIVNKCGSCFML